MYNERQMANNEHTNPDPFQSSLNAARCRKFDAFDGVYMLDI